MMTKALLDAQRAHYDRLVDDARAQIASFVGLTAAERAWAVAQVQDFVDADFARFVRLFGDSGPTDQDAVH